MEKIVLELEKINKNAITPSYMTEGSSGVDLSLCLDEDVLVKPFERVMLPTGIKVSMPRGYELQVRSRSGLSFKKGLVVINSPGTIDSDYRGEIKVLMINLSNEDISLKNGDRVAQMVLNKVDTICFKEVKTLSNNTERGSGGFGHTG